MESEVVSPLGHPSDLIPWCYLSSDLHPETFTKLRGSEWETYVLELAGKMQLRIDDPQSGGAGS
jgi:hypothetical protein